MFYYFDSRSFYFLNRFSFVDSFGPKFGFNRLVSRSE